MNQPAHIHSDGSEEQGPRLVERIVHQNIEASKSVLASNGCRRVNHALATMYRRNGDCRRRGVEDRRSNNR